MFIRTFPSQNQLFCNLFGKFNPPQNWLISHQNISFGKLKSLIGKIEPSSEIDELSIRTFPSENPTISFANSTLLRKLKIPIRTFPSQNSIPSFGNSNPPQKLQNFHQNIFAQFSNFCKMHSQSFINISIPFQSIPFPFPIHSPFIPF